MAVEGLECTNIHFHQVNSFNWICQRPLCSCLSVHCKALQRERKWSYGLPYLDTTNTKSTSNLYKHVKFCWGEEAVEAADQMQDVLAAHEALENISKKDGSILKVFE